MEAVTRSALDETDAAATVMPRTAVFEIQIVMARFIAVEPSWSEPAVNELVVQAEHARSAAAGILPFPT